MTERSSPLKPRRDPRPAIRSPAFRRKFEEGMPRINHKAIPFHNLYNVEVANSPITHEQGLKFWGCVMPEPRKFKTRKVESSRIVRTV